MKTITVITGFGYFINKAGNIDSKAILPPGRHNIKDDFTYIEVADKAALDLVSISIDVDEQKWKQNQVLIAGKMRELAINALKQEGKLPPDYDDKNPSKK